MPYVRGQAGVVVGGAPLAIFEELRVKTVTTGHMRPGRLVKRDTTDSEFQLAGAGDKGILGFIGRDPTKDAGVDLAAGQWARIGHGPNGIVAVLSLDESQTIVKGDRLVPAANGRVKKATAFSVSVPSGAVAVTSTAAQPDLTEAGSDLPEEIVGKAEESVTTGTSAFSDINVRWKGAG